MPVLKAKGGQGECSTVTCIITENPRRPLFKSQVFQRFQMNGDISEYLPDNQNFRETKEESNFKLEL